MTPKSADPSRYKLHVVSFSVVREAAPEDQPSPKLNDPNAVAHLARQIIADDAIIVAHLPSAGSVSHHAHCAKFRLPPWAERGLVAGSEKRRCVYFVRGKILNAKRHRANHRKDNRKRRYHHLAEVARG